MKLKVTLTGLPEHQIAAMVCPHWAPSRWARGTWQADTLTILTWIFLPLNFLTQCTGILSSYLLQPLVYYNSPLCCRGLKDCANLVLADPSDAFCCIKEKQITWTLILFVMVCVPRLLDVINNPLFHWPHAPLFFQEIKSTCFLSLLL